MSIISRLLKLTTKSELDKAKKDFNDMGNSIMTILNSDVDHLKKKNEFFVMRIENANQRINAVEDVIAAFKVKYSGDLETIRQGDFEYDNQIANLGVKINNEHKSRVEWQEKMNLRLTGIENTRPRKK